jgi:hypothetical protein
MCARCASTKVAQMSSGMITNNVSHQSGAASRAPDAG